MFIAELSEADIISSPLNILLLLLLLLLLFNHSLILDLFLAV
jgi:hypothetical protein